MLEPYIGFDLAEVLEGMGGRVPLSTLAVRDCGLSKRGAKRLLEAFMRGAC